MESPDVLKFRNPTGNRAYGYEIQPANLKHAQAAPHVFRSSSPHQF